MRHTLTTLFLLMAGLTCSAQGKTHMPSEIGMDIGAAIRNGTMKIHVSHAFSKHWSVEAGAGICLTKTAKGENEDEKVHNGSSDEQDQYAGTDMHSCLIRALYWPGSTFNGLFLHAGCTSGDIKGIDMTVGGGYEVRILKGLAARVSCSIGLTGSYRSGTAGGELITIEICYTF